MAELKLATDEALDDARAQVKELIDSLRFDQIGEKVTEFGREKPVALALAALTVGFAAGLLMRRTIS